MARKLCSLQESRKIAKTRQNSKQDDTPPKANRRSMGLSLVSAARPIFVSKAPSFNMSQNLPAPHISSSRVSNISLIFRHPSHSPFSGFLATPAYMQRSCGHRASGSNSSQLASFLCASHRRPHVVHLRKCISHILPPSFPCDTHPTTSLLITCDSFPTCALYCERSVYFSTCRKVIDRRRLPKPKTLSFVVGSLFCKEKKVLVPSRRPAQPWSRKLTITSYIWHGRHPTN